MKYQNKSFSIAMPGDVKWPFKDRVESGEQTECGECGGLRVPGSPHMDQRDVNARRPRKRVCMGKVIAG